MTRPLTTAERLRRHKGRLRSILLGKGGVKAIGFMLRLIDDEGAPLHHRLAAAKAVSDAAIRIVLKPLPEEPARGFALLDMIKKAADAQAVLDELPVGETHTAAPALPAPTPAAQANPGADEKFHGGTEEG